MRAGKARPWRKGVTCVEGMMLNRGVVGDCIPEEGKAWAKLGAQRRALEAQGGGGGRAESLG